MTTKYFNVKNGLSAGNIALDAASGNTSTTNLTVTEKTNLGNVGNITITGGSNNYVLQTDGTGNLTWVVSGGGGGSTSNISNGNSNVNIATANGNVTVATAGNTVMTVTGTGVNVAGTLNTGSGNINTTGNVSGAFFIGNGSQLTGISGGGASIANGNSNVNIATANGNVTITAVGNTTMTVTGTGVNVAGTLNTGSGNINTTGNVSGAFFLGNGSQLTGIGVASIANGNSNVNIATANGNITMSAVGNANIVVVTGTGVNVAGTLNATGNVTGAFFIGNGSQLTGISGGGGTSIVVDNFIGDGTTVAFTLSVTTSSINQTSVNYNGASQLRSAYTVSGTTLTFSAAPTNGSLIEVTTTLGVAGGSGAFITRNYSGTGSLTTFTVTSGTTVSSVLVSQNGLLQVPTIDYTITGTVLTFVVAPVSGQNIQIRELAVSVSPGSPAQITVQDEGSNLTSNVSVLNFVGDGVTATNSGSNVTITISGIINPFLLMGA